ncbi:conserved hypothetical protein [Vibrio aestuarianus]|uniref:Uncharacterized protein n=1 Tax=Vibrio aestuarianus TaxID=28171 RepID=A0A9X4IWN6_9VIBR|nr:MULTISPECIES: hypothetical protein [Vibrio]MDE1231351.1 hypothetical protein [Vibrio aestuarianus]MDE1235180.1 hypothetical protein [Vibrio aestuarianus]MDE1246041.1 hypothetical protein [Vibrio aestuarianus]MDE1326708.1 hypothetical protein [Vibrio aestuarianus]MDE1331354.1 hypothetical protein [Vibrio aestuarianus]
MKNLREIVFKSLVEHLNVDANMFSRIEGNEPISIELNSGEEIYIDLGEDCLQTFIEIPIRDNRIVKMKANQLLEMLLEDEQLFLNVKKDKVLIFTDVQISVVSIENELTKKLNLFNRFSNIFNTSR